MKGPLMKERIKADRLWLATVFMETDVPSVRCYQRAERLGNGWRVAYLGGTKILRDALERKFFTDVDALHKFLVRHLEHRIKSHEASIAKLQAAQANGVSVHQRPPDLPVLKKLKL